MGGNLTVSSNLDQELSSSVEKSTKVMSNMTRQL